uniref:Beta-lactamase-related domain-containing protein n=1 Tax=Moniliophthora roreri TaxID=221103 RepID=A0A0W0FML0_MONRR
MNATTYSFDVADASGNLADGICRENFSLATGLPGTGTPRFMPYWFKDRGEDGNFMAGAGGVISSANDMAIWLQTLLLWGKHPQTGEVIIPEEVLRTVASGVTVADSGLEGIPSAQAVLSPSVYGGGQLASSYRGHYVIEHGGGVNGAHSIVARLPFDNIGVAVLTNDDDIGPIIREIIKYRLIDEALGLEPYDWDSIIKNVSGLAVPTDNSSRPTNASDPSIDFTSLAGTYNNPGYGNFTFCLVSLEPTESCRELVANASTLLPGAINPTVPTLLAKADAVFAEYVALTHSDGNKFDFATMYSFSTNNSEQPFWAKVLTVSDFVAEFAATDNGIGMAMNGGFWGAGAGDPTGDSLEERAEVWFRQVVPST